MCISFKSSGSHREIHDLLNIYCSDDDATIALIYIDDMCYYNNFGDLLPYITDENTVNWNIISQLISNQSQFICEFLQNGGYDDTTLFCALTSCITPYDINYKCIIDRIRANRIDLNTLLLIKSQCIYNNNPDLLQAIISDKMCSEYVNQIKSCYRAINIMLRNFS
jgi:hypothetical protein